MSSEEEYYEEEYYEESDETKPVPLEYDYGEYLEWLNKHNDQIIEIYKEKEMNFKSTDCKDCVGCSCSKNCANSKELFYCENCINCEDCKFCYDCQGLKGKVFHRNNKPYYPNGEEFDVYYLRYGWLDYDEFCRYADDDECTIGEYCRHMELKNDEQNMFEQMQQEFTDAVINSEYQEKIDQIKILKNENQELKHLIQQYQNLYPLSFQQ